MVGPAGTPRFRILGPVEYWKGGRWHGITSRHCRSALAILLLARGRIVTREQFIDSMWDDEPPSTAAVIVRGAITKLRRWLPDGHRRIATRDPGYQLQLEENELDADLFLSLVEAARRALTEGNPHLARELAEQAMAMRHGPVLAGVCAGDALTAASIHLDEYATLAEQVRTQAMLGCGQARWSIPDLRRNLALCPIDEKSAELLMNALIEVGKPAEALVEFDRIRSYLAQDLGVDPGPELRNLHTRVLNHYLNAASTGE